MELFELYYTFKRELISIDIMILLYFRPSLRSDLYKTQEDIYIMFIAPEIKLMIRVRLKSDMINYRFLTSETNLNILLFFTQPNQ